MNVLLRLNDQQESRCQNKHTLGGVIHTYQKFDPVEFPSPTAPPPDLVSPAFEHLLHYGNTRRLTEEELARAVRIDPSQIRGLGPSLDYLRAMLEERKRKILETYETGQVEAEAHRNFHDQAEQMKPPGKLARQFQEAVREEQLHDLEQLWYRSGDEHGPFARQLLQLAERLGEKYQVDELAAKYEFTGRTPMDVPKALEVKKELEAIDKLLKQTRGGREDGPDRRSSIWRSWPSSRSRATSNNSAQLQEQIQEYLKQMREQQGIEEGKRGFQMTPRAYRLFQSKLLTRIFEQLQASRSGRHQGPIIGEGATEMQQTRPYEFGDSVTHMDIPASFVNALLRSGPGLAGAPEDRRHRHPQDAQQPQVRLGRAAGHERLDALRRPVRQRQAHGPGPRRPDPHRVPRRFPAIHRDVHVRQAAARLGGRGADAEAGDALRSGRAACRRT